MYLFVGFIPGFNFKFGATFQDAANDAIHDHMDAETTTNKARNDLQQIVNSQSSLTPRQSQADPYISSSKPTASVTQFSVDLPPIPGYMGWVPRYQHCGLGKTQKERSKEALQLFNREQEIYRNRDSNVTITDLR